MVAECRSAGYLVERQTAGGRRLYALMAGMSSTLPDELRALLGELISDIGERVYLRSEAEPGRARRDISVISAPVFDHHRRQVMTGVAADRRAPDRCRDHPCAKDLVSTADTLTAQLGGHKPLS